MEMPVELEFQGIDATPEIRKSIASQIEKLEQRYGRITACRIVVKGPGNRRQNGGQYDIGIRLALPDGREVNIGRTPKLDERHADLAFALNDAFKRARRQLEDNTQRMGGIVKNHVR